MTERLRVGTRRSPLARTQTASVLAALARANRDARFQAVPVETSGDRDRSSGASPDFTDTIDRALLAGEVDLAVHSAKDLPVRLAPGLELLACPARLDPRDCLVTSPPRAARRLPRGAVVGSSSPRRRAQLLRWRSDLRVVEIRGNVDSRLRMVRSGTIDAAVLAVAGIARLRRTPEIGQILPSTRFLPSPAQGALAVVGRAGDAALRATARRIDHAPTRARVRAERAVAAALGADCRTPLGALAAVRGRSMSLSAEVLSPDGRRSLRRRVPGSVDAPEPLGTDLGRAMREAGALELTAPRGRGVHG